MISIRVLAVTSRVILYRIGGKLRFKLLKR